jgi:DNA repair protein RadC
LKIKTVTRPKSLKGLPEFRILFLDKRNQIIADAKPLGVVVHDHIIVGKQGHASFRGLGLI